MSNKDKALGSVATLKIHQKAILMQLSDAASAARKSGDHQLAKQLKLKSIELSRQNLVIHRAMQKILKAKDLAAVNQKLADIVAQSEATLKGLNRTIKLLEKVADFITLLRRLIDVFK
ncbi:MAG: hypothetical protein ACPG6L_08530 [Nereida ignava]